MQQAELIIFDCDGVLIDSEIIVCRLVSEVLTDLGYPITLEGVIERFAGRPQREMVADIEADWGRSLPDSFFAECKLRTAEAYRTELRPIDGVRQVLDAIDIPVCVASSAYPEKLRLGLQSTGLYDKLAPNLISASFVARGKPDPDVFAYAAGWMRRPVTECVVVEDSIPGVQAGRRAGMRVIGFTGGSHCPPGHAERLIEAGAETVLAHMQDLPTLVPEAFNRKAQAS
jgi:HAD superfamily hydrolase (TIGR01509 family)